MDAELLEEDALRATFEGLFAMHKEASGEDAAGMQDMDQVDVDMNLLMNLLQSHAEGMGMPQGPAHALLSQLGVQLPRPPPMSSDPSKQRTKGKK